MRDVRQIAIKQRRASGIFFEQSEHVRYEPVVAACGLQKSSLLGLGKVRRLVKEDLDSLPARAVHLRSLLPCSCRNVACYVSTVSLGLGKSARSPKLMGQPCFGCAPIAQYCGFGHFEQ